MITCHVRYEIDPEQIDAFERFATRWMELVNQHRGVHHGYFLPAEGASDVAYALFSFPSLAKYLLTPGQPQPRGQSRNQEEHEPQAHDR